MAETSNPTPSPDELTSLRSQVAQLQQQVEYLKGKERALQESEERFRFIFENLPDGLVLAEAHTAWPHMVNNAFCEMTGYDAHEVLQLGILGMHPEERVPEELEAFKRNAHLKTSARHDVPMKTKDGRVIYVDVHGISVTLGGAPYLLGVFRDITEQRRTAKALEESERQLRDVFENVTIGIYRTDPSGEVLMANPAFVRMLGYSSFEELAQRNLEEVSLNLKYRRSAFKQQLEKEGRVVGFESAWTKPDGSVLNTTENARIVRDADGHVLYYEGTIEDITERVRMEAAVRENERLLRAVLDATTETIIVLDSHLTAVVVNETAARRMGRRPEEIVGLDPRKAVSNVMPPEAVRSRVEQANEVLASGKPVRREDHREGRTYDVNMYPIFDAAKKVASVVVFARDITERRQAQNDLEEYRAHMARAERLASLGTLSATIAHEMNQPLTVIRLTLQNCLAQLDEEGASPQEVADDLKDCLEEMSRTASIVDRFRSFARQTTVRRPGKANMHHVVEKIVRLWEGEAQRRRVRIVLQGLEGIVELDVDEGDMEQVLFCLLENAIQAADGAAAHEVRICGVARNACVEISVADDCGGIAPEHVDKLFEPFFTTKGEDEGTGLGLCIVQQVLSRAGGKIRVENRPGEGATFVLSFPFQH